MRTAENHHVTEVAPGVCLLLIGLFSGFRGVIGRAALEFESADGEGKERMYGEIRLGSRCHSSLRRHGEGFEGLTLRTVKLDHPFVLRVR